MQKEDLGSKLGFKKFGTFAGINNKGHLQGIFWTICAGFFSNLCDTCIRLAGSRLPSMQITFFRLFLGTLFLLPLMLFKGSSAFRMRNKSLHILRIIIGFGAISCWVCGASQTTLPSITIISFTCPILVLPMAYLFLGEKLDWKRVVSVIIGFLGILVIAVFEKGVVIKEPNFLPFHSGTVFLFLAAALFAISDILNKKMIGSEGIFSLLFYFYLGTSIISFIPALLVWQPIDYKEIIYLLILGIGGLSTLFCILKAVNATEISSIAPYKYIELIFSIVISYLLFGEIIRVPIAIGMCLIIPNALQIAYYEINKEKLYKKACEDIPLESDRNNTNIA